jgi:hypothetical protein
MAVHDLDSLRTHIGHRIVCVGYGAAASPANVAVECETCGCVLIDFDKDAEVDDDDREQT